MKSGETIELNDNEKNIYFILVFSKEQNIDFNQLKFTSKGEFEPLNIYNKEISNIEHKVFKLNTKIENKKKKDDKPKKIHHEIVYEIGNYEYIIKFDTKDNSFVYDLELKKRNKFIHTIVADDIDQKFIQIYNKLEIFVEALGTDKNQLYKLYEETIDLYKTEAKFNLLIPLFLQVYDNKNIDDNKILCSKLLSIFNEINQTGNTDRSNNLDIYLDNFMQIFLDADNIINYYEYDPINFYGIILCYLNYYEQEEKFSSDIKKIYEKQPNLLYQILVIYYSHFINPINQDKEFFNNFIEYIINNKEYKSDIFEKSLNYIKDIETIINVINHNKDEIINTYDKIKPIELSSELNLKKKDNELDNIKHDIEEIIDYSEKKQKLVIFLKSKFWINFVIQYNKADLENISNLFKLRNLFKNYYKSINKIFKDIEKIKENNEEKFKLNIKKDIDRYYKRDEFAFILNKNIRALFENDKNKLSNAEILGVLHEYNPYYNIDDEEDNKKFKSSRDVRIFDFINFDKADTAFIQTFKNFKFELIFKENIIEFLNKLISKIKTISNFGTIMELIDITSIPKQKEEFFNQLKYKYDFIIENEIKSLKDEELNNAIKILSKFTVNVYLNDKNFTFLEEKINKLDNKINSLIYNELIKEYNEGQFKEIKEYDEIEFEKMKEYIYKRILNRLDDIDNIIRLLNSLKTDDKKKFLQELMKKCQFIKEEFYSNNDNNRIKLICYLNEKEIFKKSDSEEKDEKEEKEERENYFFKLTDVLDDIHSDLEEENINKNQLEEFLKNKNIIEKLGLLKLVLNDYAPAKKYEELKKSVDEINEKINKLKDIKDSLSKFHRSNKFLKDIQTISIIINDMETKSIKDNKKWGESIQKILGYEALCKEINVVKDFLLFKVIFDNTQGKDQEERFNNAKSILKELKDEFQNNYNINRIFNKNEFFSNIFNKIKEILSKKEESEFNKFINQMKNYFQLKEQYEKDFIIIFKSKKYEKDVKSIKFFFDNFSDKKLALPDDLELSTMELDELKETLNKLKEEKIYDYNINHNYYKIFTSIYGKKEAIDFLVDKIKRNESNIDYLKDRLDPTNKRITPNIIDDAIECLNQFNEIAKKNDSEIMDYITSLNDEQIEKFINYSKHYKSIIELDNNNEISGIFGKVDDIIKDSTFTFDLNGEYFSCNNKILNMEQLIHINIQINIHPKENENENDKKTKDKDKNKNEDMEIKCKKLLFFKNLVSNLEIIYNKMKVIRLKGCCLPILIKIKIEYQKNPKIKYYLNKKETEFVDISEYLFKAKNNYEEHLNEKYKDEKYLRFLHGKLFRKIMNYLYGDDDILELKRYILNKTEINDKIEDGKASDRILPDDYVKEYNDYNKKTFNIISSYISDLFNNNKMDLEEHYKKMLIKEENKYKGIFLLKCENHSMEEYTLYLFLEKLDQLPIAQNILICSQETSIEEIQSFIYRTILCDYNTLFIVELTKSFSDFQYNKMYNYIDKLLSYKVEEYKKDHKNENQIEKINTKNYLESCLIFLYDKDLDNNVSFLNELGKYAKQKLDLNENIGENFKVEKLNKDNEQDSFNNLLINISFNNINTSFDKSNFDNIKVISSEICGLGKSYKIRKMIGENKQKYYYFPLGGYLTKRDIYNKLKKLINTIKKDEKKEKRKLIQSEDKNKKNKTITNDNLEYKNIAVHLDLAESDDDSQIGNKNNPISVINEFLLSFLITKFYIYGEDIIYIPNNINIYIEIPNCFTNYLKKIGILNIFPIENIVIGEVKPNKQINITNIKMDNLYLDKERDIIKKMLGYKDKSDEEENKDIEDFIKENIGKEYSYYQVQTFIKLFISQFKKIKGEIKFLDSNNRDITNEEKKNFINSIKNFTNTSFSKLLMEIKDKNQEDKNQEEIDKFDLCSNAYENDLKNKEIKTLFYIDPNTKKRRIVDLGEIAQNNKNSIKKKEVDIVYLFDRTGSMGPELKAANKEVIKIFNNLKKKFEENNLDFYFGVVYYGDDIAAKRIYNRNCKENGYFDLTKDMKKLQKNLSTINTHAGWCEHADWVSGYDLALNKIKWRDGTKLIIHIADDGAHGEEFSKGDRLPDQGNILINLIKKCVDRNINIISFKIGNEPEQSFEKMREVYENHKLSEGKNNQFIEIYDFKRKENDSQEFYDLVMEASTEVANPTYHYLKKLKEILDLKNEIEDKTSENKTHNQNSLLSLTTILKLNPEPNPKKKDNEPELEKKDKNYNYVITNDNYKKMILLIYRIQADVPVIIMGETGCGKTALIKKLNQILNNGKNLVKTINIDPGITDENICEFMKEINKNSKNQKEDCWVFFDEINTCLSFTLLTEIFINRTFNGEKLNDNIRLIGACNPYRKKNNTTENYALTREDDVEDMRVYKVNQLPLSLLNYVFSFGSIEKEDEKKYIGSIIDKLFNLYKKEEKIMHEYTRDAIYECHEFLREVFNDSSIVSLRELSRFVECVEFFKDYFQKKGVDDEIKVSKINSIICSIYICYYTRLINDDRPEFNRRLKNIISKIINPDSGEETDENDNDKDNDNNKYKLFKEYMRRNGIQEFDKLLEKEEDFLLEQIDLDKGIGKNKLLKENIFLLFLSVVTKIPLIIVGKPGTGKSLSAQLIINSMRGKYSTKEFFQNYPQIFQIYFQGSESTSPEEVEKLFENAKNLCENSKNKYQNTKDKAELPIYMILFDELGLAEKSPTNPLKVLHKNLEYGGNKDDICFIGISNYTLDPAKLNRAFYLAVPNLESQIDMLKETAKSIVENISYELVDETNNNIKIFNILSEAYYDYKHYLYLIKKFMVLKQYYDRIEEKDKKELKKKDLEEIEKKVKDGFNLYKDLLKKEKKIKLEFHGNRDFYNIIKGVAIEGSKLSSFGTEIGPTIEKYIERNFGGIYYEIDIDYNLVPQNKHADLDIIKKILGDSNKKSKNRKDITEENIKKFSSVYIFKKIYNLVLDKEENSSLKELQINNQNINKYNLNTCINDNINDNNARFLLLEIKSNLATLIVKNIKIENPDKKDIEFINGSQFSDDNNKDYRYRKINEILEYADKPDKLIILQNLNQIQAYLYDFYNRNYKIIDEQKYTRICYDNHAEQLIRVDDSFRVITLVEKNFINSVDNAFLNRLEKIQIHFSDLLGKTEKLFLKEILEEIKLEDYIKDEKLKFNYDLTYLIINCGKEEIGGLVYNSFIENKKKNIDKNDMKEEIYSKISYLLPQDIIIILPEKNELKEKYKNKKYNNIKQYLNDLKSEIIDYKISIIYTFSGIADNIEGFDDIDMKFMISEINKESKLKEKLYEIIDRNENKKDSKSYTIFIHFEQFNSNKIQFISDYILQYKEYFLMKKKEDRYKYIFLIHIQRNFSISHNQEKNELKNKNDIIYSIPNINNRINQLFIDNLNGLNISLSNLLKNNIKEVIKNNYHLINLDEEFYNSLLNFVYEEKKKNIRKKNKKNNNISNDSKDMNDEEKDIKDYYEKMEDYIKKDNEFKTEIIKKVSDTIDIDTKSLFDKMVEEKNINKKTIDIISCILKYYKENIFKEKLYFIFKALEDNNFLTTLIEIKNKENKLENKIIKELKKEILNSLKLDDNSSYEPKFLSDYKIPGFYNFYKNFSDDINKNITIEYFNNEKKLREYFDEEPEKIKKDFHTKEESLLQLILDNSQDKYKFYFDIMKNIIEKSSDLSNLILEDYITFYLDKNIVSYSKSSNKIIQLLLKLRFSKEKNQIIKKYEYNSIAIILIKIMWIESNINYIKIILNIFNDAKGIIINDKDGNKLYKMVEDLINDNDVIINYIVDADRNPEHTREVNECFYILLASLCLSLTSDKIKLTKSMGLSENIKKNELEIIDYNDQLRIINNNLQIINDDLLLYMNELYIIDELIIIIDYQLFTGINNKKISDIEKIRNYLRESSMIIQKNPANKIQNLKLNFTNLYNLLEEEEKDQKYKKEYYDTLKHILLKEIRKVNNINYRAAIINKLIDEKEIIKNSNDIFQIILLDPYLYNPSFKNSINNLLAGKDDIIIIIDKYLSDEKNENYFTASNTFLYFFEKNSLIYFQDYLLQKNSLEDEPKDIFKESIKYLKNPQKFYGKLIHITKLFCLGYIKAFCYKFIKMHEQPKFKPDNIIDIINKYDENNMVKLYIYKIIYNQNNKQIDVFINDDSKEKYKLYKYDNFKNFIKLEENDEKKFNYGIETLDNDNYNSIYDMLAKNKENEFNNKIPNSEINSNGKLCFDNFYVASYYLILSDLGKKKDISEIHKNFYDNVCESLIKNENSKDKILINDKLLILFKLFFEPSMFTEIKEKYEIKPKDIEALLYGYRYCLNEIAKNENEDEEEEKIFSVLYDRDKLNYLSEKLFPGSDTEDKQYYELYYQIENHFKKNSNAGCYICLCDKDKGYYHSISSQFPGSSDINIKCPYCNKEIGAKEKYIEITINENEKTIEKIYEPIIRDNYFRIFKDEYEIDNIKRDKNKKNKLKGKYMTKKAFKENYINKLYKQEKGLHKINENKFKKNDKIIRNLSQVSYRLLNYILYSHLFFSKLFLDSQNIDTTHLDSYLPGEMTWINTINECFILLQKELLNIGIKQIEIFMNLIFVELFNKLHDQNCIDKYDDLIDFEDDLELLIKKKIEETKKEIERYKKIEEQNCKEKTSAIALLKEIYTKNDYDEEEKKEFPYYEYFYYTDYIDENYIYNILEHEDKDKYPILSKYLDYKKEDKKNDNKYNIDNFVIFNRVLNLFSEKYSNKIAKEIGETQILMDSEIYQTNNNIKSLIDNFIKIYNYFELEDKEKKSKLKLDPRKNYLCDFFLYDDNKYGKSYKEIYEKFINIQNKELTILLDKKIEKSIFNNNCKNKISVQQIKEDEIFTYNPKNDFNFIEIIFNSSYRKIIDNQKYEDYNEYIIDLDAIETRMTNSLLKGKKLLNNKFIEFIFNDEVFSNEINDLIFTFEHKYDIHDINIDDKMEIYNYIDDNKGNNKKFRNIINDFIILINYLIKINNGHSDNKEDIGNTQISKIIEKSDNISKDFKELFKDKKDETNKTIYLTVNKITNLLDIYLKLIFKYIKEDIEKYQEKSSKFDKKKLDSFLKKNSIINKKSLANAVRIFISVVLYMEKDKNKIKSNKKNIIGYLDQKDLWDNKIYTDEKFQNNLGEIKSFNIKINEILRFYDLINDEEEKDIENIEKEIVESLNNIKKEGEKSEEEKEVNENQDNENSSFELTSDDDTNNKPIRKRAK